MATASRTRQSPGAKQRARSGAEAGWLRRSAPSTWLVPGIAVAGIVLFVVLGTVGVVSMPAALAGVVLSVLVLLLFLGERPLLGGEQPAQARGMGAVVGLAWLALCYYPFHARLFQGTPLVGGATLTAAGQGLPLEIPAAGHGAIDLELEGKLEPSPTGGVAPAVHYRLTLEDGTGTPRVVEGVFEDSLKTRRLGRRGTATVHQTHTTDVRVIPNPGGGALKVTQLVLEPESANPITVSVFAHPLPGPIVLTIVVIGLLAAVVAFDRLGPVFETDGALTLATASVVGTAIIFWTSNTVHPDFQTLIGSAIFGGPLGFAAGALLWWVAKHLIAAPAR
jgi:hypothetical protein